MILKFIRAQNQIERDQLIPVIATVLHFSPNEVTSSATNDSGLLGGVLSYFTAPGAKPLARPPTMEDPPPAEEVTSLSM